MQRSYPILCLILVSSLSFLAARGTDSQADDFSTIRERVVAELLKTPVAASRVTDILARMQADGSFGNIDYSDLSRTAGFPHRHHTADLVVLATAYRQPGQAYYRDAALLQKISRSLEFWVNHDFFGDNWHDNQITTPTNLVNLMLLVGEELPDRLVEAAQPIIGRAHMQASGARPSGDRIVIAGILAKNLLFRGDQEAFDNIIRLIEGEIKFSTGQRGMQHDYSFHHRHDRVNNTTSYGYGKYANAFGEWSYYVAGTAYAFAPERINHLIDYYLEGIYPQLVYGTYTDISVKNRSISQQEAPFAPHSTTEIERLLISSNYRRAELEQIMRLRRGEAKPDTSFCKFFWQTEHFVCQRPGFYTTVRMFSTRNRNMEEPYNGPGKTTHHRADGTNYLMLRGDEYHNIWPVYDWQKISGTTILQKPQLPGPDSIQLDGLTDFVGAVTDGKNGAVAFDFRSPHDGTRARKSWFFFDEEYVCLGAGIRAEGRLPVVTTVNQALLRGAVTAHYAGQTQQLAPGRRELSDLKWVYHDRVGYILPTPTTAQLSNQTERGRWSDITDQKNISTAVVEKDVFALWFDHGIRPDSATYAYIVVPGVSEEALRQSAASNRGIRILANSPTLQAVGKDAEGLYQLTFYEAGAVALSAGATVRMGSQGMTQLQVRDGRITALTVADPSRKLAQLLLTLPGIYRPQLTGVRALPDTAANETLLVIDLPRGVYAGQSRTLTW